MTSLLRTLTLSLGSLLAARAAAQSPADATAWADRHFERKTEAMTVLTGWGATNVLVGGAGALVSDDRELRQFHLMNAGWGAINAALGLFGRRSAVADRSKGLPLDEAYADLRRTEKILLFNAGLDVAYMAGGAYVLQRAKLESADDPAQLRGFGKAIILQGAALMAFDLLAYRHLHRSEVGLTVGLGSVGVTVPIGD